MYVKFIGDEPHRSAFYDSVTSVQFWRDNDVFFMSMNLRDKSVKVLGISNEVYVLADDGTELFRFSVRDLADEEAEIQVKPVTDNDVVGHHLIEEMYKAFDQANEIDVLNEVLADLDWEELDESEALTMGIPDMSKVYGYETGRTFGKIIWSADNWFHRSQSQILASTRAAMARAELRRLETLDDERQVTLFRIGGAVERRVKQRRKGLLSGERRQTSIGELRNPDGVLFFRRREQRRKKSCRRRADFTY